MLPNSPSLRAASVAVTLFVAALATTARATYLLTRPAPGDVEDAVIVRDTAACSEMLHLKAISTALLRGHRRQLLLRLAETPGRVEDCRATHTNIMALVAINAELM